VPTELLGMKALQKIHCNLKYASLYKDFVNINLKPIIQEIIWIFSGMKMKADTLTSLPQEA
jgi:hypothetical protein